MLLGLACVHAENKIRITEETYHRRTNKLGMKYGCVVVQINYTEIPVVMVAFVVLYIFVSLTNTFFHLMCKQPRVSPSASRSFSTYVAVNFCCNM